MQTLVTTVQLDARVFEDGYWVEWFDDVGGHGRVGDAALTEHGALALLESMHNALTKAKFKLERAPDPAMVLVHASVDDVERVTGQRLRGARSDSDA
jgi:hypothetical protein